MPGNPKDSEWYSTPRSARRRKGIELTLPDDVVERLEKIAKARGISRSEAVGRMIRDTPIREREEKDE